MNCYGYKAGTGTATRRVDVAGATPDAWLNEQYARRLTAAGERGVVLSRIGASLEDFRGSYPGGPWGEHRSTVHFTGDTAPTGRRSPWPPA